MEGLAKKVEQLLKKAFPSLASLDIQDDDGIIGVMVSMDFQDLDAIDRQNKIWDVLERTLTPEEQRQIQIIVAETPAEHCQQGATAS